RLGAQADLDAQAIELPGEPLDMATEVGPGGSLARREHLPAQVGAGFEEDDEVAAGRGGPRSLQTGRAATDDGNGAHLLGRLRLPAAEARVPHGGVDGAPDRQ